MKRSLDNLLEVYMEVEAFDGALQHCKSLLPLEAIGFLVGRVYKVPKTEHLWTYVLGCIPGKSRSTRVHVEFVDGAMGEVVNVLRSQYKNSFIVGWYHSHPGYGCFLSDTDIDSQSAYFKEPYHVALVIDPARNLFDFYKQDTSSKYREASFCVDNFKGRFSP